MGINTSIATLLSRARQHGISFRRTLTIGRQSLTVPDSELKRIALKYELKNAAHVEPAGDGWADEFFVKFLGAESVASMDYSNYQSASIVHDLNTPIPPELREQFDAVIDGGSIEHIFDIKQTLENYMNMVKVGGNLFIATPANNMCGHGFYQFSPEFFYRVFNAGNGFGVKDMILIESPLLSFEARPQQSYFCVKDPEEVQRRVELLSCKPVMLFVHAERISSAPLFSNNPYQSDYQTQWRTAANSGESVKRFEYDTRWKALRRRLRQWRKHGLHKGRFFSPFKP